MPQCTVRRGHGKSPASTASSSLIIHPAFESRYRDLVFPPPEHQYLFASEVSRSTRANQMRFSGTSLGISLTRHSPNVSVSRRGPHWPSGQAVGCSGHSVSHPPQCIAGQAGKVLPLCPARPSKTFLEISVNE